MNEQHNEAHQPETPAEDEVIPPSAPVVEDGYHATTDNRVQFFLNSEPSGHPENADQTAYRLNIQNSVIENQKATITRLESEQILGSDTRLTEFWAKAQELADRAGHCQVFDEIAEALGGPRREREYTITVDLMVSVPVSVTVSGSFRSDEDADDYARDYVRNMSGSEFEDQYTDWYSAEADTYSMNVSVEED